MSAYNGVGPGLLSARPLLKANVRDNTLAGRVVSIVCCIYAAVAPDFRGRLALCDFSYIYIDQTPGYIQLG